MMETKRNLTCIVCPRGCQMIVTLDDGKVVGVEGNFCRRGATYANDECTNPRRTVTSTVRCLDDSIVSVKTESTIPKEKMFEVMDKINSAHPMGNLKIGDIVIENVCDTGVNVVATSNSR